MKDDFKGSVLESDKEFVVILSNDRYIDLYKKEGKIIINNFRFEESIIDDYSKLKMKNGIIEE